ncbi:MAG: DUF5698 domain-containing protein [Sphaerochaeta sp.]|nr:DUF5698 domain-containing protein [Sphaerochaeta sp.]
MFTVESLTLAAIIFVARVFDVSLATLRHAMIIRGKRLLTFWIAFFEMLIWVFAVSKVLSDLSAPITALAFALGFATGTFVGITLESKLKIGDQVVKVFSSIGHDVAVELRSCGFRVTEFTGQGRDGEVILLFVQVRRRDAQRVLKLSRTVDPNCYLVVEDIRWRENVLM